MELGIVIIIIVYGDFGCMTSSHVAEFRTQIGGETYNPIFRYTEMVYECAGHYWTVFDYGGVQHRSPPVRGRREAVARAAEDLLTKLLDLCEFVP